MTAALRALAGAPSIEKYEILAEIGSGGMATVYRARDQRLGRDVAVKVIHKHLRDSAEVAKRFVAEARASAKLKHPGIVEVYDVSSEDDPERYLVVELLRGTTLRKILEEHRDMPAEVGASIVACLCEALEHAHECGIIHRDVKPENVLVELARDRVRPRIVAADGGGTVTVNERDRERLQAAEGAGDTPAPSSADGASNGGRGASSGVGGPSSGEPASIPPSVPEASTRRRKDERSAVVIKLTDFGIAKILDAQGVTSTGQVLGSPAHMAPEQIEGGEIDARTDVFALGVLFYECVVGHLPFEGKNPAQVLRRVLDGRFSPVERERPTTGARWGEIVAGTLALDPATRTQSPGALRERILSELEALGFGPPKDEITAYFDDPTGYSASAKDRVVAKLVARGEDARKRREVWRAAADFNRALALAPGDPAILKKVTSLSRGESRRGLAKRAGLVVLASALLGLGAFGTARWVKARRAGEGLAPLARSEDPRAAKLPASAAPGPSGAVPERASSADAADPSRSSDPIDPSAAPPAKPKHVPGPSPTLVHPTASATGSAAPVASVRKVKFNILPKGARLTVDGAEVKWFAQVVELTPGPHAIDVRVPSSKCCKALTETVTISAPPEGEPDQVQHVSRQLPLLPATVTLGNAPKDAQLFCPGIGLSCFSGQSKSASLPEEEWRGTCEFKSPEGETTQRKVVLRAGEANSVAWPL